MLPYNTHPCIVSALKNGLTIALRSGERLIYIVGRPRMDAKINLSAGKPQMAMNYCGHDSFWNVEKKYKKNRSLMSHNVIPLVLSSNGRQNEDACEAKLGGQSDE